MHAPLPPPAKSAQAKTRALPVPPWGQALMLLSLGLVLLQL
jgi:hypothetical protein